jgi:hypothetical protein
MQWEGTDSSELRRRTTAGPPRQASSPVFRAAARFPKFSELSHRGALIVAGLASMAGTDKVPLGQARREVFAATNLLQRDARACENSTKPWTLVASLNMLASGAGG